MHYVQCITLTIHHFSTDKCIIKNFILIFFPQLYIYNVLYVYLKRKQPINSCKWTNQNELKEQENKTHKQNVYQQINEVVGGGLKL